MRKTLFALLLTTGVAWGQTSLEVQANPEDALIFVDREMRGKGHVMLTDLAPGPHLLRVAGGEDYEPVTQTLQLDGSPQRLQFHLVPSGKRLIESGRRRLAAGNLAEARQRFARALSSQPVSGNWWLGVACFLDKDYDDALTALRKYAQYTTEAPQLHLLMGRAHELSGQSDRAFTAYKAALLKKLPGALQKLPPATYASIGRLGNPTSPTDQLRLAQLLMLKGDHGQATGWAVKAVRQVYGDWEHQDWNAFEPPVPKGAQPEVVAPEDSLEPR